MSSPIERVWTAAEIRERTYVPESFGHAGWRMSEEEAAYLAKCTRRMKLAEQAATFEPAGGWEDARSCCRTTVTSIVKRLDAAIEEPDDEA